jgi:hypothetical protein
MAMTRQLDFFQDNMLVSCETQQQQIPADPFVAPPQSDDLYGEQQTRLTQLLQEELEKRCSLPIKLTVTDNTSTMMSVRHSLNGDPVRVRLHRMFLTAPKEVRNALVHWVKHPRSRKFGVLFREFIVAHTHEIRNAATRAASPVTRGTYYDLKEIFDDLNRCYFDNAITVAISWGRDCGRNLHSIRFGGYYPGEQLIRIHPRLDQSFVPPYIIRYIVYHEMLHAHLGIEQTENGRKSIHPRAFKRMESAFPDYAQSIAWIENSSNLCKILRRCRTVRPEQKKN